MEVEEYGVGGDAQRIGYEKGARRGPPGKRRRKYESGLKRWNEAFARFGVEVDGVVMLQWTPEVERFLAGEVTE